MPKNRYVQHTANYTTFIRSTQQQQQNAKKDSLTYSAINTSMRSSSSCNNNKINNNQSESNSIINNNINNDSNNSSSNISNYNKCYPTYNSSSSNNNTIDNNNSLSDNYNNSNNNNKNINNKSIGCSSSSSKLHTSSSSSSTMPSIAQDNADIELLGLSSSSICTTKNTTLAQQQESLQQQEFAAAQRTHHHAYGTIFHSVGAGSSMPHSTTSTTTTTAAFEQYRLQLYNYALNIERLRCPQYSAAAAMAAAAAYAHNSSGGGVGGVSSNSNSNSSNIYGQVAGYVPGIGSGIVGGSSRLALSMSLFPQRIFQPEEPKPQHSYIGLIAMAILSSAETKLVLSDIYQYILDNYAYFRTRGPGWRNSIRHNLSLNDCFIKSGRSANGKGHYWAIHPANMEDFRKGDFRRRKAQRKVRKHMGLTVDDAGTDSPSPPTLDLTASPPLAVAVAHAHHSHQLAAAQQLAAFGYLQQQHHHHQQQQHHHPLLPPHQQQQLYQTTSSNNYIPQYAAAAAQLTAHIVQPHTAQIQQPHENSSSSSSNNNSNNNSNNSSSNHPQQQQSHQHLSHPRLYTNTTNQLAFINETTTTTASVIANLYSQSRKRQFDVASLLAPDVVKVVGDIVGDVVVGDIEPTKHTTATGITTTQHTVITKVSVQHQQHHHHHQSHLAPTAAYHHTQQQLPQPLAVNSIQQQQQQQQQHHLLDLELDEQEGDIDVVDSDDLKADDLRDQQQAIDAQDAVAEHEIYTDALYADNNSLHSSLDAATTTEDTAATSSDSRHLSPRSDTTTAELHCATAAAALTMAKQERNNLQYARMPLKCGANEESTPTTFSCNNSPKEAAPSAAFDVEQNHHGVQRLMLQHLQQQPQTAAPLDSSSELSGMDPHIFGRYYGTYMAAAAARRIGGMQLNLQYQEPPSPTHSQQQQHPQ